MRTIPLPSIDSKQRYTEICNSIKDASKKDIMETISNTIITAYDEYDKVAPGVHQLMPNIFDDDTKTTILEVYKNRAKSLRNEILRAFPAKDRAECPYCGINEPDTLDHVLPKIVFYEFILHFPNLVPSCTNCNRHKASNYLDTTGNRRFIHTYFEPLNDFDILQCTITSCQTLQNIYKIIYSVSRPDSLPLPLFEIIEQQFKDLDLAKRFCIKATTRLSIDWENIRASSSLQAIEAKLSESFRINGRNHWETAYYKGLLALI